MLNGENNSQQLKKKIEDLQNKLSQIKIARNRTLGQKEVKIKKQATDLSAVKNERDSLQNKVECLHLEITELKITKKELESGLKEVENELD